MSQFYVIRHKPSGTLLPARVLARVLATHYEFSPWGSGEPRLFKTERAAKNCATCWAQGAWSQELRTESDGWESPSYDYLAEATPKAVEGRKREDLEVVPVKLELLS